MSPPAKSLLLLANWFWYKSGMRLRYLLVIALVALAGCETAAAVLGMLSGEGKVVDNAINSPNAQIQAEGVEAKSQYPWMK